MGSRRIASRTLKPEDVASVHHGSVSYRQNQQVTIPEVVALGARVAWKLELDLGDDVVPEATAPPGSDVGDAVRQRVNRRAGYASQVDASVEVGKSEHGRFAWLFGGSVPLSHHRPAGPRERVPGPERRDDDGPRGVGSVAGCVGQDLVD